MAAVYDPARGVVCMTMEDWKQTHADYKSTERDANGTRYRTVLYCVPGKGTSIVPVVIVKGDR